MIAVIRRRDTAKNEIDRINKQGELVKAHNHGKLGRHWYKEDVTGENTGEKGKAYLSPVKLRRKI